MRFRFKQGNLQISFLMNKGKQLMRKTLNKVRYPKPFKAFKGKSRFTPEEKKARLDWWKMNLDYKRTVGFFPGWF